MPVLSIIVPCYRKAEIIEKDLLAKKQILDTLHIPYEIVVVIDGLVDKTEEVVSNLKIDNLKIIAYEKNQGKGYAVRKGYENAQGSFIGYLDADFDIDPK